jgi:hypothetical protein
MPKRYKHDDAEDNKKSLRWFWKKYHPYCEIGSCLNDTDRVLFTVTGPVSICNSCFERLGIRERETKSGLLHALPMRSAVTTVAAEPRITCPTCGRTSFNPEDVKQRYCGFCHEFLEDNV